MSKIYFCSDYYRSLYDVFLTYANFPFRDNPENIWKLFKSIKHFEEQQIAVLINSHAVSPSRAHQIGKIPEEFRYICTHIVKQANKDRVSALNDYSRFKCYLKNHGIDALSEFWPPEAFDIAFMAVWGGCSFYSCSSCKYNELNSRQDSFYRYSNETGEAEIEGQIKCHECDQIAFIEMLIKGTRQKNKLFMDGKYDDLLEFLAEYRNLYTKNIAFLGKKTNGSITSYTGEVNELTVYDSKSHFSNNYKSFNLSLSCFLFSTFIYSIVGYSFLSFLNVLGIENLKRCPYCNSFFIPKDIKREYCYNESCRKRKWRETKQIQRDKNPEKYY